MPERRPNRFARRVVALLAVGGLLGTGCTTLGRIKDKSYDTARSLITSSYHDPDPDGKMARAESLFENQQYEQAQVLFGDLAENTYNPVLMAEKARYMEAECLRLRGKTFDAVTHYNRMLQDHPAGVYREKACVQVYQIAFGWLKESTLSQVEGELKGQQKAWWEKAPSLPNFVDASRPMLDQEGEAIKYLEVAYTHDLTGPTADKALFWCGYVHFYRGRYEEADHYFSQLVEMHKESPLWDEALRLAVISKNNSTGGSVYDSTKASEALQLVHHAEASVPDYVKDPEKSGWLTRQKMAVRMQLADKDFEMAKYYERINHPASAYFYYELVARRYPGSKYADMAQERLTALKQVKAQMEADKAAGKPATTWEAVRQEWGRLTGRQAGTPSADKLEVEPKPTAPKPPSMMLTDMAAPR